MPLDKEVPSVTFEQADGNQVVFVQKEEEEVKNHKPEKSVEIILCIQKRLLSTKKLRAYDHYLRENGESLQRVSPNEQGNTAVVP